MWKIVIVKSNFVNNDSVSKLWPKIDVVDLLPKCISSNVHKGMLGLQYAIKLFYPTYFS